MIIGVNGYAGSGKDTIGTIIQYLNCFNLGDVTLEDACKDYKAHNWWLENQSGWEIKKWAGKLKTIASLLTGIPLEKFEDQEFKKTHLNAEWNEHGMPISVRDFLQRLGTDALRDGLHDNIWVNALMADYYTNFRVEEQTGNGLAWGRVEYPNWIITDTRFPNEAKVIKDRGGIIIRVNRSGFGPINNHPSEVALDHWNFDYTIENDATLSNLADKIQNIIHQYNVN